PPKRFCVMMFGAEITSTGVVLDRRATPPSKRSGSGEGSEKGQLPTRFRSRRGISSGASIVTARHPTSSFAETWVSTRASFTESDCYRGDRPTRPDSPQRERNCQVCQSCRNGSVDSSSPTQLIARILAWLCCQLSQGGGADGSWGSVNVGRAVEGSRSR